MAPVPLEGNHHAVLTSNNLPQEGNRGGSISLSILIDFILQRTYHEVTVLAELLPRKTDIERKIEIYNFSVKTRQLFVRLLALVKWANSASKVDKSAHIMSFLDKQSLLFVDTADILARIARETLVHARLPNFHIPAAVEVLTVGTYGRLPTCIKEKIVPPDSVSIIEKKATLQRLNQVIQHRIVTGHLLPQMRNLQINNGRVTFYVDQEFKVSLTVMGDGFSVPWKLLEFEILVSDRDTGDGKQLVHPLQIKYIHQLIQARLIESNDSLSEVYNILHYFCQSLQLEVLYSQTLRLIRDRLDDYIHIEEYVLGKSLNVLYWKELSNEDPKSELGYKLCIFVNENDPSKSLSVGHIPSLESKETEISNQIFKPAQLSMEFLIVQTIYIRTKNRLLDLKQQLERILKNVDCSLAGSPAVLSVPILQPCLRAELLLIAVNTHTGMLKCHVPSYDPPIIPELISALNSDHLRIKPLISELRFWITRRRCEKTLQHLPATPFERLPLLYHADHPISKLNLHKLFVKFHKYPNIILIVELKEKNFYNNEIEYSFYISIVKPSSIEDNPNDESMESDFPKTYLKLQNLIEFDTFVATHGPFTNIDCGYSDQENMASDLFEKTLKRRNTSTCGKNDIIGLPHYRKPKLPAYFIPELAHVVALCDERIPFILLAQELTLREISHQGLQIEANATALVIKIVQLPNTLRNHSSHSAWLAICKKLLSVSIRVLNKGTGKAWLAEFIFHGSPLVTNHSKEQSFRRPIYFQYEMSTPDTISKTVDQFLNDWAQIINLYSLIHEFSKYNTLDKYNLRNVINIKSFNYSKIIFLYGPLRNVTVTIYWNATHKKFELLFGKTSSNTIGNPHSLIKQQLETYLNRFKNLMQLMYILNETFRPLTSIYKLPIISLLGVHDKRPLIPVQTFTIMPQSVSLLKIAYQGMYCLEIRLRGGGLVSLRDGAYSRFDRSNVINEFTPTQGLKTFLSKYIDENAMYRRRSQSEDDNPPSPVAMETENNNGNTVVFLTHHKGGPQSPAQQRETLRFHTPLTPPSGSNPHTPASPHTNLTNQHQSFGSSPATSFNLASPPSLPPNTPNILPHASPSSGLVPNSPINQLHAASPAGLMSTSSPGPCSNVQVGHSPVSSFVQSSHIDSSPYPSSQSLTSPATSNWPGSPSVPRPSPVRSGHSSLQSPQHITDNKIGNHLPRVLPQRSWAGAVPTLLTYETLELLCCPSVHPTALPGSDMSPLERFLGCVYLRRQLQRFIQTDDCLTAINSTEPGVVHFKVETLQCRVSLNSQHLQSLVIKIQPLSEYKDQWSLDELQTLEKFFENRAAAPPYKPNALSGFSKLLNLPLNVLKDFIQLIKIELFPNILPQIKWSLQWCLCIPPSAIPLVPIGQPAILVSKSKILFFLQISKSNVHYIGESINLVLPLIYDINTNIIQVAEKRDPNPTITAVSMHLKRYAEYINNSSECSILPTVRDILVNLTLPSEHNVTQQMVPGASNQQLSTSPQISNSTVQLQSSLNSNQIHSTNYVTQGIHMGIMGSS